MGGRGKGNYGGDPMLATDACEDGNSEGGPMLATDALRDVNGNGDTQ